MRAYQSAIVFCGVFIFAAILGILTALLPPVVLLALTFLPILIIVAWNYPAMALLILISVLYGVIPSYLVPSIPLGGGNLQANDLALGCLFLIVSLQSSRVLPEIFIKLKPLTFPLLLLIVLFSLSLIFSIGYFHNPVKHVLAEVRNFLYWLILPIVVAIVTVDRTKYQFILNGLMTIGYIISAALIFQHLTGIDILGSGRVEKLVTLEKTSEIIRTTSPGIYLVILSIYFIVSRWLSGKISPLLAGLACTPLILGLLVTFGRGVWIASALSILLLAASISRIAFLRLFIIGSLTLSIILSGLFIVKPETGEAIADRLFSVAKEVDGGSSAEWRYLENTYAIEHVITSPIVGVGIGGFAHPKFHPIMTDDLLRYVHNGYLYLVVKIGIFGLLIPITIMWRVGRWFKANKETYSESFLHSRKALLAVFFVPCITSFTQPEWMVYTGVGFLALVLGLLLVTPSLEACEQ